MSFRDPLAPRLGAVLAVIGVTVVAVLVAGALTSSPSNDTLITDELAGPTSSTTSTPATVLGTTVERLPSTPAAPTASVPAAATTDAPPPPTTSTTTSTTTTASGPLTTTVPPTTTPPTQPEPTTVSIALDAAGSGDVTVTVTGPSGSQSHELGPGGGARLLQGLPPGTYQLFARVSGPPSGPDDDGTQLGGGALLVPSTQIQLAAGDRLSARFDGSNWTLVLS